ncbi:hypothetical protein GRB29_05930 [Streptococcus pneumoniae]|nr:hypothetical protein [Streptococcus pneumoniae]
MQVCWSIAIVHFKNYLASNMDLDFTISPEDLEVLKTIDFKDYGEFTYFPSF